MRLRRMFNNYMKKEINYEIVKFGSLKMLFIIKCYSFVTIIVVLSCNIRKKRNRNYWSDYTL